MSITRSITRRVNDSVYSLFLTIFGKKLYLGIGNRRLFLIVSEVDVLTPFNNI